MVRCMNAQVATAPTTVHVQAPYTTTSATITTHPHTQRRRHHPRLHMIPPCPKTTTLGSFRRKLTYSLQQRVVGRRRS